ncbi:MAG: TetR/AcrR family transcriptional regulator [Rickettsiales bacterium]
MKPALTVRETKRRADILAAATRLFLQHGYAPTTMDAIASRARVTKQTVYAYFPNKNALFQQMIVALCEKYTSLDNMADAKRPLPEQLYQIGLALGDWVSHPDVLAATRLVIAESKNHPKLAQLYYESGTQRVIGALAAYLAQQNALDALHIGDCASAASYFFAMLKGQYYLRLMLRAKPFPARHEKEQHVRETVELFLRAYGGKNPLLTKSAL